MGQVDPPNLVLAWARKNALQLPNRNGRGFPGRTEEFTELGIKVSDLENGEINPATDPHYYYDNFHSLVEICTSRAHVTPLPLGPDQME